MSRQVKDFAYVLSNYLSVYLPGMKGVSPNTILSYRDTFSLFLRFCKEQRGISPEKLSFQQMNRTLVEDFLNWLETDRNCSISTGTNGSLLCVPFLGMPKSTIRSNCCCANKWFISHPRKPRKKLWDT